MTSTVFYLVGSTISWRGTINTCMSMTNVIHACQCNFSLFLLSPIPPVRTSTAFTHTRRWLILFHSFITSLLYSLWFLSTLWSIGPLYTQFVACFSMPDFHFESRKIQSNNFLCVSKSLFVSALQGRLPVWPTLSFWLRPERNCTTGAFSAESLCLKLCGKYSAPCDDKQAFL